ncbi:interleukin-12 subunit alpha, partial [Mugil cephalus]|uniref:interleukin-12 subunit alpha n=1 Tax=Mugil cephalus TaxID=48193 RepID=UPI001FB7E14A
LSSCHADFVSCVLLLTLNWRTSTGIPVPAPTQENREECSSLLKNLVKDLPELLNNSVLCFGITSDKVDLLSNETVLACAPNENSSCMMQRTSSFSESDCLRNIMRDFAYYDAAIQSYLKTPLRSPKEETELLKPTLETIQSLRKCSPKPNEESESSEEEVDQNWGEDSFGNRHRMCKIMRGFHVRTITINRAMGYIYSGDYRK